MELYFSATPNLFDGMEMLEVLLQDKNNVMDEEMKIAILTAVVVFFLFSFLELFEVKYVEKYTKQQLMLRTKVTQRIPNRVECCIFGRLSGFVVRVRPRCCNLYHQERDFTILSNLAISRKMWLGLN